MVLVYRLERWLLTEMERVNAWERNILTRIYGPVVGQGI